MFEADKEYSSVPQYVILWENEATLHSARIPEKWTSVTYSLDSPKTCEASNGPLWMGGKGRGKPLKPTERTKYN